MRFCGTRGGDSFMNAIRPEPTGKNGTQAFACPEGFEPCSHATSLNNTICTTKDNKADCPITFMKFFDEDAVEEYLNDTVNYKVHEVDDDIFFVTSKTKGNNLPLTSFRVESKPCLDPKLMSRSPGQVFYPLETDRKMNDCHEIKQFHERYDTRYVDMGLSISEADVQEESEVDDLLHRMPNYQLYVNDVAKKQVKYHFWSRSTISWKLECDESSPRTSVVQAAADA